MTQALWLDAAERTIAPFWHDNDLAGRFADIDIAHIFPNGDVLYVENWHEDAPHATDGFIINDWAFANVVWRGNAVLAGPDISDHDDIATDVKMTSEQLAGAITWITGDDPPEVSALWINGHQHTVTPCEVEAMPERFHRMDLGAILPNNDVLWIENERYMQPNNPGFRFKQNPDTRPVITNALVTGPLHDDSAPHQHVTYPPQFTARRLAAEIEWLTADQVIAWFQANDPAPKVSSGDDKVVVLRPRP